jgi:hypothetical protein
MSVRTRIVYFVINPYSDARAPVAALIQVADTTRVVRAVMPDLAPSARFAVDHALTDIEALHDFDELPIGAGPQFVMGEPRTLPNDVPDPSRWVLDHVLRAA